MGLRRALRTASPGIVLVLVLAGPAAAGPRPQPMRFTHLTVEMGLSQGTAFCTHQDSQGFVWIGTEDGLNRFDGVGVKVYRHDSRNPASIPSDFVWAIAEDSAGDLWIGTDGGGLARWERKTDRFTTYRNDTKDASSLPSNRVRAVAVDRSGFVWAGTKGGGLARLDRSTGRFTRFCHDAARPSSLSHDEVYVIREGRGSALWVGTDAGLDRLDAATGGFVHEVLGASELSNGDRKVRAIEEDTAGNLWVGTFGGGLVELGIGAGAPVRHRRDAKGASSLADDVVHAVMQDRAGRLWIGTRGGLDLLGRNGGFIHYRHDRADPDGLPDSEVMSLLEDRSGVLWCGTRAGGVSRWNPATWAFGHVVEARAGVPGLSNGYVTSFAEDREGHLWVGTLGGGINVLDRTTGDLKVFRKDSARAGSLPDDRVMTLLQDRSGDLWAGTMDGGLARYQPSTGSFVTYRADPSRPGTLSANAVTTLYQDDEGALWIGTFGGGLDRRDPATGAFTGLRSNPSDPDTLGSDIVTAIAEGPAGVLWVGTEGGGLGRLDGRTGKVRRLRHDPERPESLCDDTVYSLHVDPEGTLWVGTRKGLARLDRKSALSDAPSFQTYDERNGLPSRTVYGIRPDGTGRLWLATNTGLSRLEPKKGTFLGYGRSHGLQGNEFNFGAHHRSSRGELFFGGTNGFNAFFAESIPASAEPPPVVLTSFLKFNKEAGEGTPPHALEGVRLGHRDQVVTLEFAALAFAAPEKNQYTYKLEGFDPGWIELGNVHRVTYTSLPSGRYVFRVKAANHDGTWNEKGLAIPVRVLPPPWRTWWAYLLYTLLAGACVAAAVQAYRKKQAREADYRRRLEVEVEARTLELGRKNDELEKLNGQLVETSLTDSLTGLRNRRFVFEEVNKELSLVQRQHNDMSLGHRTNADQLIFMMVDLDWFKPVNDTCGHAAGDNLLRQVRAILEKACRKSDVIVRWGGDEFLVVGRVDDLAGVEAVPERIRSMIEEMTFELGNSQIAHLTCSIGFTCYPAGATSLLGLSLEQVIALADRALYDAKGLGRNAWVGLLGTESTSLGDILETLDTEHDATLKSSLVVRRSRTPQAGAGK